MLNGYCKMATCERLTNLYDEQLGLTFFRRCENVTNPLHWGAHKLRCVTRSSITVKILAAAETVDVMLYLQKLLREIHIPHHISLATDYKVTFELSTSIREPADSFNKVALATTVEAFRLTLFSFIGWSRDYHHVTDLLAKNNQAATPHLLKYLRDGICPCHPSGIERTPENLEVFSS